MIYILSTSATIAFKNKNIPDLINRCSQTKSSEITCIRYQYFSSIFTQCFLQICINITAWFTFFQQVPPSHLERNISNLINHRFSVLKLKRTLRRLICIVVNLTRTSMCIAKRRINRRGSISLRRRVPDTANFEKHPSPTPSSSIKSQTMKANGPRHSGQSSFPNVNISLPPTPPPPI